MTVSRNQGGMLVTLFNGSKPHLSCFVEHSRESVILSLRQTDRNEDRAEISREQDYIPQDTLFLSSISIGTLTQSRSFRQKNKIKVFSPLKLGNKIFSFSDTTFELFICSFGLLLQRSVTTCWTPALSWLRQLTQWCLSLILKEEWIPCQIKTNLKKKYFVLSLVKSTRQKSHFGLKPLECVGPDVWVWDLLNYTLYSPLAKKKKNDIVNSHHIISILQLSDHCQTGRWLKIVHDPSIIQSNGNVKFHISEFPTLFSWCTVM